MNNQKMDRRVRRTRTLLKSVLLDQLKSKPLKEISVIELTDLADINRGTFYLHFKDIYDLYEQIVEDLLSEFVKSVAVQGHSMIERREELFRSAFDFMSDNAEVIEVVMTVDLNTLLDRMLKAVKPTTPTQWRQFFPNGRPDLDEYCFAFITSACVGLFKLWFGQGRRQTSEFMARFCMKLVGNCIADLSF